MPRSHPRLFRLAAVLLGLAVAGLLAEGGLRLMGVLPAQRNPLSGFHRADPLLGWRGVPHLEARFVRPEFDVVVAHGPLGFRAPGESHDRSGPILAVAGDSFVWGWGVQQGEVLTDRLEGALDRPVRNLGLNAAGTAQQVLLLEEFAADAPDALLLFFHNDLKDNTDRRGGERPVFDVDAGGLVLRPPSRARGGALFRRSRLLSLIRLQVDRVLAARRGGPPGIPACDDPNAWALEAGLLARAAVAGPRLRLVYVPTVAEVQTGSSCRDGLATLGSSLGLPVLDPGPALAHACREWSGVGDPCYYARDGHWTARGHRVVADAVAEWLLAESPR